MRTELEEFLWQASDLLDRIDDLQEDITRCEFAEDANGALLKLDHHKNMMKNKITKLPIEALDTQGKKILAKFKQDAHHTTEDASSHPSNSNNAQNGSSHGSSANPDRMSALNQVRYMNKNRSVSSSNRSLCFRYFDN